MEGLKRSDRHTSAAEVHQGRAKKSMYVLHQEITCKEKDTFFPKSASLAGSTCKSQLKIEALSPGSVGSNEPTSWRDIAFLSGEIQGDLQAEQLLQDRAGIKTWVGTGNPTITPCCPNL